MTSSPVVSPDWSKTGSYWFDLWDSSARDDLCTSLGEPKPGTSLSDDAAMFLAAAKALQGVGRVSPNPLVGAVIVDERGRFLSSGAHLQLGGPHAEVNATQAAIDRATLDGATIFVTLEPCAHVGRTPACASMLAGLGFRRIVYAVRDPNPLVDGAGHKILQDAGKTVELDHRWTSRCEWLARVFLYNQRHQRVFTALKVASTPDGVVAGDRTSRLWITGERARQFGHFLRLEYDAILIGGETLRLDNPTLNVRHPNITGRTPLRIVLDAQNKINLEQTPYKLLTTEPSKTMIVSSGLTETLFQWESGLYNLTLPVDKNRHFDFEAIKKHLWTMGLRSLLIEGGAGTYQSALSSSAVDVIHWFIGNEGIKSGVTWAIPEPLKSRCSSGFGIVLGPDRLVEMSLSSR